MESILQIEFWLEQSLGIFDFAKLYISPVSINYNYTHRRRFIEVKTRLDPLYYHLLNYRNQFIAGSESIYNSDTVIEWVTVYVDPYLDKIFHLLNVILRQTKDHDWSPRPLPITLKKYPKLDDLEPTR